MGRLILKWHSLVAFVLGECQTYGRQQQVRLDGDDSQAFPWQRFNLNIGKLVKTDAFRQF